MSPKKAPFQKEMNQLNRAKITYYVTQTWLLQQIREFLKQTPENDGFLTKQDAYNMGDYIHSLFMKISPLLILASWSRMFHSTSTRNPVARLDLVEDLQGFLTVALWPEAVELSSTRGFRPAVKKSLKTIHYTFAWNWIPPKMGSLMIPGPYW